MPGPWDAGAEALLLYSHKVPWHKEVLTSDFVDVHPQFTVQLLKVLALGAWGRCHRNIEGESLSCVTSIWHALAWRPARPGCLKIGGRRRLCEYSPYWVSLVWLWTMILCHTRGWNSRWGRWRWPRSIFSFLLLKVFNVSIWWHLVPLLPPALEI